ncbi:hypothetical protein PRIPAC_79269 [Pristionchus pacificus]|uniref:Glycoside hydrolase n=1 Tax=Pristionchus pacificus TaxID=54126 RepID=A0A2A6CNE2_PRIPA|nr:hypothetical protein PRIPAC_79269 [Pristionchus pacificus]|eukprot:PDM79745.1 glycoside hydrolase [Pristionchus pacificus]
MLSTPFDRLDAEPKGGSRNASTNSVASRDSRSAIMHSNENLTTWDSAASNVSGTSQPPAAYPANVNPSYVPAGRSYPPSDSIPPLPVSGYRPAGQLQRKRNRLQEWKASCCRPLPLIVCGVLTLLIIGAIIAIAVTQSQANEERRFDNNGQPLQQYSANQQQLPESLQNRQGQNGSGTQPGQQQGMLSNTISASSGYTPNIQPQVAAGQSSPNTNGITNGNGIPNVGQSSPNLYNNMQQTGSQQTNGLYNFPQNGQNQVVYGNGGMNIGSQGAQQQSNYSNGGFSNNGINSSPYAQNGQHQRPVDMTGYAPNVMSQSNSGQQQTGASTNGQMPAMNGVSSSGQTPAPSSGYVPNIAQPQSQPIPNNQLYGIGRLSVAAPYINGCYLANWAIYRPEPYKFTPHNIPIGLCTHIFYAFAAVNVTTFQATSSDDYADITLKNFDALNKLKKQQPGLTTMLSFGGWTESQTGIYSVIAADPVKRSTFVQSAWAMAAQYGFDGIDLDWEYPGAPDRYNYIDLLKDLKSGSVGKMLTAAVPAKHEDMIGYNVYEMNDYLDYFNVMTYDLYGADETEVQHHASYSGIVNTLQLWKIRGADRSKLLMGIPAYGVGWIADRCFAGTPDSGPIPAQKISGEDGKAAYFELKKMTGQTIDSADGPYFQTTINGKNGCYGFDNPTSILKKMEYVKQQGLAGAFTWTVDFDDLATFELHYAIKTTGRPAAPSSQSQQPNNRKRNRLQELKTRTCSSKTLIGILVAILLVVAIVIVIAITQFNDRIGEVFIRPSYGELPNSGNYQPPPSPREQYASSFGVQPQYGEEMNGLGTVNNGLYQSRAGEYPQQVNGAYSGQLQSGSYGNFNNRQQNYPTNQGYQGYGRRRR